MTTLLVSANNPAPLDSTYTQEQLNQFREDRIKSVLKGCIAVIKAYSVFKDEYDIVRDLCDYHYELTNDLCFNNVKEIHCFDDSDDNRLLFLQLSNILTCITLNATDSMESCMKELTDLTAKLLVRFNYGK